MIGVINYGSGNFTSVLNGLRSVGAKLHVITTPADFARVSHVVLPGVGAFQTAMKRLSDLNLVEPLKRAVCEERKWFLGICVGMQILTDVGYEGGAHQGLELIPGECRKINTQGSELRLPHIGWNEMTCSLDNPLFQRLSSRPTFYFVHSFQVVCADDAQAIGRCDYGESVTAVVQRDNIYGVQFHPEKSQQDGLQLLKNFIHLS